MRKVIRGKKPDHEEEFVNAMVVVVHDWVRPEKWTWFKKQMERALHHLAELQKESMLADVRKALDSIGK